MRLSLISHQSYLKVIFFLFLFSNPGMSKAQSDVNEKDMSSHVEWLLSHNSTLWTRGVDLINFDIEKKVNELRFQYRRNFNVLEISGSLFNFSGNVIINLDFVIQESDEEIFSSNFSTKLWNDLRGELTAINYGDKSESEIRQLRTQIIGAYFSNDGYTFANRPGSIDFEIAESTRLVVTVKDRSKPWSENSWVCRGNILDVEPKCTQGR